MNQFKKIFFTRLPVQYQLMLLIAFTVFALMKNLGWVLDLFSHFHIQYAVLSIVYLLYFAFKQYKASKEPTVNNLNFAWLLLATICLVINVCVIWPVYTTLYQPKPLINNTNPKLSLLLCNVFVQNNNTDAVVTMVKQYDADIVALQEIWGNWSERIEKTDLKQRYPYQAFDRSRGNLILSKLPILSTHILSDDQHLGDTHARLNLSILDFLIKLPKGQQIRLINMHPSVPVFVFASKTHKYMEFLNRSIQNVSQPLIVYGDFNTTVFSSFYQQILQGSGLHNAREGFGFKPTWPSIFPPLWIGIDHVMLSRDLHATAFKTGPHVGSDHLPVYVELALPITTDSSNPSSMGHGNGETGL